MDMNTPSVAPAPKKTIAQLQADIATQQQAVKDLKLYTKNQLS